MWSWKYIPTFVLNLCTGRNEWSGLHPGHINPCEITPVHIEHEFVLTQDPVWALLRSAKFFATSREWKQDSSDVQPYSVFVSK